MQTWSKPQPLGNVKMTAIHLVSCTPQKALCRAEGETIDRKRKGNKTGGGGICLKDKSHLQRRSHLEYAKQLILSHPQSCLTHKRSPKQNWDTVVWSFGQYRCRRQHPASPSLNKTKLTAKHFGGMKERRDCTLWLILSPQKRSVTHNGTGGWGSLERRVERQVCGSQLKTTSDPNSSVNKSVLRSSLPATFFFD